VHAGTLALSRILANPHARESLLHLGPYKKLFCPNLFDVVDYLSSQYCELVAKEYRLDCTFIPNLFGFKCIVLKHIKTILQF
jgi:hypothetical protein